MEIHFGPERLRVLGRSPRRSRCRPEAGRTFRASLIAPGGLRDDSRRILRESVSPDTTDANSHDLVADVLTAITEDLAPGVGAKVLRG